MNEIAPIVAELLKMLLGNEPFLIAYKVTFEGATVHVPDDHSIEHCVFIEAGLSIDEGRVLFGEATMTALDGS